jgi:ABC-type antimicrobial peptide transport system permease subunit
VNHRRESTGRLKPAASQRWSHRAEATGAAATAGYASIQGWIVVVPVLSVAGGVAIALLLGALAGLYPAARAARLAPAAALRSV